MNNLFEILAGLMVFIMIIIFSLFGNKLYYDFLLFVGGFTYFGLLKTFVISLLFAGLFALLAEGFKTKK